MLKGRGSTRPLPEVLEKGHKLADKSVADVCEALIGAAYLCPGAGHPFDQAVKAVSTFVQSEDHSAQSYADYYKIYKIPSWVKLEASASQLDLARQIEEKMGYRFTHPRLLRSAFVHPSYPFSWERVPCYQRLEFLGDALLDLACIHYIYQRFPDRDPQWLTEHKVGFDFTLSSADPLTS